MLPNGFPDSGETPEYNTVDATLWFFEAIRAYLAYTGDLEFLRKDLYSTLTDIVSWHVRGTRFGIKVDSDGLLSSGEPGVQLTWMDAKVGDWVVTPRHGTPVEIQALWYNALHFLEDVARRLEDETGRRRYGSMAARTKQSFNPLFWNEKSGYLHDVVDGGPPDSSIRPNQILAVSLPYTMLNSERAKRVLDVVQQHLLTPLGLRSLAPSDPQYRGRYTGGPASRDAAYHQGTVWPWLMGSIPHCIYKGTRWRRASQASGKVLALRIQRSLSRLRAWPHLGNLRRRCAPSSGWLYCAGMERSRTTACHGRRCLWRPPRFANLVRCRGRDGLVDSLPRFLA